MLPNEKSFRLLFNKNENKNKNKKVESARGRIARTYLYIENAYIHYKMSKVQKTSGSWGKMHPVSQWECKPAERIEKLQGNKNKLIEERCLNYSPLIDQYQSN